MNVRQHISTLPSSTGDWRLIVQTARLVLSIPRYAVLALVSAVVGLSLFVVSLNLPVVQLALTGTLPSSARVAIIVRLFPFVGTGVAPLQDGLLLVVAAVSGVDIAVVTYTRRRPDGFQSSGGETAAGGGLRALVLGIAAWGTGLLVSVLWVFGVTDVWLRLPLGGLEFVVLALVALLLSIHWVAAGMHGSRVTNRPVDPPGI